MALGLVYLAFGPSGLGAGLAQEADLLDRAEAAADRGETLVARDLLSRWERESEGSASVEERARGWFLKARLTEDAERAEVLYIRVVIEGSSTRYADDALLRLAQYSFVSGDHSKAIEYLGKLRRDYPTSEHGPDALLWIARTASAQGDGQRACQAAEQGLKEVAPIDTALARALAEARRDCGGVAGRYTVQVAALHDALAAQRLAQDLLDQDYTAWILNATPSDPLYRVRVGRSLTEEAAQDMLRRLEEAGFSPFLVVERSGQGGGG